MREVVDKAWRDNARVVSNDVGRTSTDAPIDNARVMSNDVGGTSTGAPIDTARVVSNGVGGTSTDAPKSTQRLDDHEERIPERRVVDGNFSNVSNSSLGMARTGREEIHPSKRWPPSQEVW